MQRPVSGAPGAAAAVEERREVRRATVAATVGTAIERGRTMQRIAIAPAVVASILVGAGASIAQAERGPGCSDATLRGGYGSFASVLLLPAGTPRSILGRMVFDGAGHFTIALTFNDNGTVSHRTDAGPYTVNSDCTGKLLTNGGTGTIEIVLVDGGNEFYQLRTDPSSVFFQYNIAKKQLPNDGAQLPSEA